MKNNGLPLSTSIDPAGSFICGEHRPSYRVKNLRKTESISVLGHNASGTPITNNANFPESDLFIENSSCIYEIPNPFPFWGTTYILSEPADRLAEEPQRFRFNKVADEPDQTSPLMQDLLRGALSNPEGRMYSIKDLPRTMKLALAQTCRDPEILSALARLNCRFEFDRSGMPTGLEFEHDHTGRLRPAVRDHDLFEVLGNNPALPDQYKQAMVLIPGIQGDSPVVGEYSRHSETHIWEYLRSNSYIPWGHYASNMAHDCVRYKASVLDREDMTGLRHLYYQRIYAQMAEISGVGDLVSSWENRDGALSRSRLEALRRAVLSEIRQRSASGLEIPFTATMWGWNYGFDFAPSGYRLHASHQQIHQQFALIPASTPVPGRKGASMPSYAVGDQVAHFCSRYREVFSSPFFDAYIQAIRSNTRLDGRKDLPSSLIVFEDENVMVHIPKAQRCQGEVQVMTTAGAGNVLEADSRVRSSLDNCLHRVIQALDLLGAEMVTVYELSKRFDSPDGDQRLFYCFLPRHPRSPGAFSERQERWITGHYPEDYAEALRLALKD